MCVGSVWYYVNNVPLKQTTPIGGGEKKTILFCSNTYFHRTNIWSPKKLINCAKQPAGWVICEQTEKLNVLKQYYEMSWEGKNLVFHFFSSYIYVMTLVVSVL